VEKKTAMMGYTLILGVLGISAIGISFMRDEPYNSICTLYLFGFIAFQWIANYFGIKEDNL
ncbi:MAG: hypothetical protein AAGK97_16520, partial [Bacteroidota bacterium]